MPLALIEAILDACAADGYRVGDLLRGFVTSRLFRGLPPAGAGTETTMKRSLDKKTTPESRS